jgi:hypothetical protein
VPFLCSVASFPASHGELFFLSSDSVSAAAEAGRLPVVKLLLDRGADLLARGFRGRNALHHVGPIRSFAKRSTRPD